MKLMLTDPISDYLTRVRNAIAAQHSDVEIPASRLKKEISRILEEQGYINGFAVEPTPVGEVIRIKLKYTDGRRLGDHAACSGSRGPGDAATSPTRRSLA